RCDPRIFSSSSSSDISVRRSGRGGSDGRLKIDKQRLRRKAIENTVQRLGERCPRRLADLPCFKALGVKISELERICQKLTAAEEKQNQQEQEEKASSSLPASSRSKNCCSEPTQNASSSLRHPFELSESAKTSFATSLFSSTKSSAPSRFGESKTDQKQQLLASFPVSSGQFHRQSDETPDRGGGQAGGDTEALQEQSRLQSAAPAASVVINGSDANETARASQQQNHQSPSQSLSALPAASVDKDRLLALADWAASRPQQQQQQIRSKSPQAWVKKHQFLNAQPITGGIGHHLMQKMGWRDGQGLGKRNEGPTEPLAIDYKTDRKGLAAIDDRPVAAKHGAGSGRKKKSSALPPASVVAANAAASTAAAAAAAAVSGTSLEHLDGKHPISALLEAARRRRLPEPQFRLVHHSGPAHSPCFVFCVQIGSTEYQPTRPCRNKKDAKACAATFALQQLGIVPKPDY
uniref:G-patch domain-containing protein n=1 Tax=Macrostomum lignano TaxID=282301 RepID=A0A1I8J3G4_9PLAT